MAQVSELNRRLQLQFQVGTTAKGAPKLQNHNFNRASMTISDDDLLAVGQALGALFEHPLYQVARIDEYAIAAPATSSGTSTTTA